MAPLDPVLRHKPQVAASRDSAASQPQTYVAAAADYSSVFEYGFHSIDDVARPLPEGLDPKYAEWEAALARAHDIRLKAHDASEAAEGWRRNIRQMPVLSAVPLKQHLQQLLRARMVVTWLVHYYVHSIPADHAPPIRVPASLAVPLLVVSYALDLPPVLTYADTEYYNYAWETGSHAFTDTIRLPLRILHTFTGTPDEAHFYTVALRIEVEGARALHMMRDMLRLAETSVGPTPSAGLTPLLHRLAEIIAAMDKILQTMRDGCDPSIFYGQVRQWFIGCPTDGGWVFEVDGSKDTQEAIDGSEWLMRGADGECLGREMAGSSAAQSSIIQALDVFLGIEESTHERSFDVAKENSDAAKGNFLTRMRKYLPLSHRRFLDSLGEQARGLPEHVLGLDDGGEAMRAYNACIVALTQFRTTHIRIATLYIVNQARRAAEGPGKKVPYAQAKGTGGTDLVPFLRGIRDRTDMASLDR